MPNSQNVKDLIKTDDNTPFVVIALSPSEIASRRIELKAFTDGKDHIMITNLESAYSIIDGKQLSPVETASPQEITGEEFEAFDKLTGMTNDVTDKIVGLGEEFAFALVGEEIYCPITGKITKFKYNEVALDGVTAQEYILDNIEAVDDPSDEPLNEAGDDDEIEEIDELSEDDSSDDAGEAGEEDDSSIPDDDDAGEVASTGALLKKHKNVVSVYEKADSQSPTMQGSVVSELKDDLFVVADDKTGENFTVKTESISDGKDSVKLVGEPKPVATDDQTVLATETVDPAVSAVKLVSLSGAGNNEVAVYVGNTHIGILHRSKASEKASTLFDGDGKSLHTAFKSTLLTHYANPKANELASFGFVPTEFKVKVGNLFKARLDREIAKHVQATEVAKAEQVNDVFRNIELAFVGLNKGVLQGKGANDMVVALASKLKQGGVKNAEYEVRKIFATKTNEFIKTALEHAKHFSTKDASYLEGVTKTLANAELIGAAPAVTVEEMPVAVIEVPTEQVKPDVEVSGFKNPSTHSNDVSRYRNLISSIGRR